MTFRVAASLLLTGCLVEPGAALSQSPTQAPQLLLHGNYCGLGNNAPLPPIDALDAACARHDACTPAGLPARACHLRLQRETGFIARDPRQPDDLRALAGLISAGAGALPFDSAVAVATRAPASAPYGWYPPGAHRPVYFAY